MVALALVEYLANAAIRREQVFRNCSDFLNNDDDWLKCHVRLPRAVHPGLCEELGPALRVPDPIKKTFNSCQSPGFHNSQIPFRQGYNLKELADRSGISHSTLNCTHSGGIVLLI